MDLGKTATKAVPRYQAVAKILAQRIGGGEFVVGSLLPAEFDLCAQYQCSRHTIREALRVLTNEGYLQRRQGSGSQVVSLNPRAVYQQTMRSLEQLYQFSEETRFTTHSIGFAQPPAEVVPDFGGSDGLEPQYLCIKGVRSDATGTAICYVEVYIHPRYSALKELLTTHSYAFYLLLEKHFGIRTAVVQQLFRGMVVTPEAAQYLKISRKNFMVRVTRRYIGEDGECLIVALNDHPAERFSYQMELSRDKIESP